MRRKIYTKFLLSILTLSVGMSMAYGQTKMDVWDFGAEQFGTDTCINWLTVDSINKWYDASIIPGTAAIKLPASVSCGPMSFLTKADNDRLRTRLDIDEWFGTVINRLVAQAVIGFPLTTYGRGSQIRGFIALADAMECMTRLLLHPPEPGQYGVVNQMTGYYNITDLANTVAQVRSEEFGLTVSIQRVENPRVEADEHPFEPIFENLERSFGFEHKVTLEEEIYKMFELLTKPHIRERIEEKKHLILPKTWWSGLKKPVEILETIEYTPSKNFFVKGES